MYIIGSVLRVLTILALTVPLFANPALAQDEASTEPAETCQSRPVFDPPVVERPSRNRPFAFNPAMQRISGPFGIDISRWDHPSDKLLNFPIIKSQGFDFVIIKLSDGATQEANRLAKKWWRIDRPAAEAAGFLVGGYHYASPKGTNAVERQLDAIQQARQASKAYGVWKKGRLPLVLDLEVVPRDSKWTPRDITNWALAFLAEAERLTKSPPMIYSYANYFLKHMEPDLELAQYPLWLAHYGVHLKTPALVAPWSLFDGYAIWQFSSSARTAGTHRNIGDLNQTSEHWLRRLTGSETNYSWAEPLSEAQVAAFNSISKNGNGERFHNRTGSSREGLTTWQTWISATNKCPVVAATP